MMQERVRELSPGLPGGGPVLYWMNRDQRTRDNWALFEAQARAGDLGVPVGVAFCLVSRFLGADRRAFGFMLAGLRQVETELADRGIPFFLLQGDPVRRLPALARELDCGLMVSDFSPLRLARSWREGVADRLRVPLLEVDAHNVVPCWLASDKQEYSARTLRPKLWRRLATFLTDLPRRRKQALPWSLSWPRNDWDAAQKSVGLAADRLADLPVRPGERAALARLRAFVDGGLQDYAEHGHDPLREARSGLSPYLHFGQISAQRVALAVGRAPVPAAARDAFLEQLLVRRELAENFCHFNPHYDRYEGLPAWGRRTLEEHAGDTREFLYDRDRLDAAETHDRLWNAAQLEMVLTGGMPGYLRMYWAKKILEWSPDPQEAFQVALFLNDRYQLDGRDPNGYTGVAWSIGGVHDRPWFERPVFGKIRYMNESGCRRKFDVEGYIARVDQMRRAAGR